MCNLAKILSYSNLVYGLVNLKKSPNKQWEDGKNL